jgi:hypothetical protein
MSELRCWVCRQDLNGENNPRYKIFELWQEFYLCETDTCTRLLYAWVETKNFERHLAGDDTQETPICLTADFTYDSFGAFLKEQNLFHLLNTLFPPSPTQ